MAKITFSALVDSMTGLHGKKGTLSSQWKGVQVLTRHPTPKQPHTAKQQRIRALINNITGDWHSLSDLQRDAWNKYASMLEGALTGFNVYVRHNTRLLNTNHPSLTQISMPPSTPSTPDFVQGLTTSPTNGNNTISWTSPDSPFQWVQVQCSPQVGFSMTGKRRWTLLPAVQSSELGFSHPISLPEGYSLYYRARTIDNHGRVSPWTTPILNPHEAPAAPPPGWLSLREHQSQEIGADGGYYNFTCPGSNLILTAYAMVGYVFVVTDKAWLGANSKKVRIYWDAAITGSPNSHSELSIWDGAYDRTDDSQFPVGLAMVTFGAGRLQYHQHYDDFSLHWDELVVDLSASELDQVTIMVQVHHLHAKDRSVNIYNLRITDMTDNVIVEMDLCPVTMERTGTKKDYGYTASGP